MGVIAIAALVSAFFHANRMAYRSREFKRLAEFHATQEARLEFSLDADKAFLADTLRHIQEYSERARNAENPREASRWTQSANWERETIHDSESRIRATQLKVDHYRRLKEKYELAAQKPWRTPPADSPEPPPSPEDQEIQAAIGSHGLR
jgi:hypothetical protein